MTVVEQGHVVGANPVLLATISPGPEAPWRRLSHNTTLRMPRRVGGRLGVDVRVLLFAGAARLTPNVTRIANIVSADYIRVFSTDRKAARCVRRRPVRTTN